MQLVLDYIIPKILHAQLPTTVMCQIFIHYHFCFLHGQFIYLYILFMFLIVITVMCQHTCNHQRLKGNMKMIRYLTV